MFPEVLDRVLGRVPARTPARVPGFSAQRLAHASYPGAVADPQSVLDGKLICLAHAHELALLDDYEGDEYLRVKVDAFLEPFGDRRSCWLYVLTPAAQTSATCGLWCPTHFMTTELAPFLQSF